MNAAIDGTDLEILKILSENARTSNAEIARQIGLAPTAIFQRIKNSKRPESSGGTRCSSTPPHSTTG
jgi:Lrp/AsnC family leucine-responsive transcriptional regulator